MDKYIIAFDFGTSKTRVATCIPSDNTPQGIEVIAIEEQTSHGIRRGSVVSPDDLRKVVGNLIIGIEKKLDDKGRQAPKVLLASINGQSYTTLMQACETNIDTPKVTPRTLAKLQDLAREKREQFLPEDERIVRLEPIQYDIDSIQEPKELVCGKEGSIIDGKYLVYTAKMSEIEAINRSFTTREKVLTENFYPVASAKASILLTDSQKRDSYALVDIGHSTTSVAVFSRDALRYEVSIPLGSDTITRDIAKALEISHGDAEHLKCRVGIIDEGQTRKQYEAEMPSGEVVNFFGEKLNYAITARVQELAAYIYSAIKEASKRGCREVKILLTGGGSNLKGIEKIIEKQTQCPVTFVLPLQGNGKESVTLQSYTACLGMASLYAKRLKANAPEEEPTLKFDEPEPTPEPEPAPQPAPQPEPMPEEHPGKGKKLFNQMLSLFEDGYGKKGR